MGMIQSIKIYSLENTKPHYRLNIFLLPAMHRQVLVNLYIHFIKYAINLSDFGFPFLIRMILKILLTGGLT